MSPYSLCLVVILSFSTAAVAQPIYGWKNEKEQWQFSDMPPAGISAKKMVNGIPAPHSLPATSQTQPNASPSAASKSHKMVVSQLPTAGLSNSSPAGSNLRWLLIYRSYTKVKTDTSQLSGWRAVQFFDSDEACFHYRAAVVLSAAPRAVVRDLNSNCIPASEFTTGKEADVYVTDKQFEAAAVGFSSHLLSGRVFNRGQGTARSVVAKYKIRDRNGVIIAQGEASTSPADVPGMAFGEFRTPSIGGWSLEGVRAQAEADWVKK